MNETTQNYFDYSMGDSQIFINFSDYFIIIPSDCNLTFDTTYDKGSPFQVKNTYAIVDI